MRYLIGIVFGLLIVFNWSSIKTYFDKNIDQQAEVLINTNKPEATNQVQQQASQTDKPSSEKKDLFKDFK